MRRDALLLAAGAFMLCMALASPGFYGDGPYLLGQVEAKELAWNNHVLFLPLMVAFCGVLRSLGVETFAALQLASALGTALGVWSAHRAARMLGLSRARCATLSLLVATTPAVLAFGTVIELHGAFCGAAGLAFLAFARCVARPSATSALLLGLMTGLATGLHSSGHVELLLLLLLLLARRGWSMALLRDGVVAGSAHMALLVAAAATFQKAPVLEALFHHHALGEPLSAAWLAHVAWPTLRDEWLLPYLPLALAPPLAVARSLSNGNRSRRSRAFSPGFFRSKLHKSSKLARVSPDRTRTKTHDSAAAPPVGQAPGTARRKTALATLGALAAYLALTTKVLRGAVEHGAYMLPLAFACALLAAEALRPRLALLLAALSLAWAVPFTFLLQERDLSPPRREQIRELAGEKQVSAIVLDRSEAIEFEKVDPHTQLLWVEELVSRYKSATEIAQAFDIVHHSTASIDRELWLTPRARLRFVQNPDPAVQAFWSGQLAREYRLVERRYGNAVVYVVERRP